MLSLSHIFCQYCDLNIIQSPYIFVYGNKKYYYHRNCFILLREKVGLGRWNRIVMD